MRLEVFGTLRSLPFLIILLIGVGNVTLVVLNTGTFYGTAPYPVTGFLLQAIQGGLLLFMVILLTFYSGELVWRERGHKLSEVFDALPVPNSVYWGAKLAGLLVVVLVMLGAALLTGVCILSYYSVIAGWTFGFIFKDIIAPTKEFGDFIASPGTVIPLFALFLALTVLVVLGGVEHGIERSARILMPILLVLMFFIILRGLTLPGASEGLRFYLKPDFSKVDGSVVLAALVGFWLGRLFRR